MISTICTLFEGHYHYGLAALVNSLYAHGYRGVLWVGYRGELPPWARPIVQNEKYTEFEIAQDCRLRFVPLTTNIHLTNYKPNFMLQMWETFCPEADALFYIDPDIVVKCRWSFFEEWVIRGIALCQEIVNAQMPADHPIRLAWQEYAATKGYALARECSQYFNGGFLGLHRKHRSALCVWKELQEGLEDVGVNLTGFMPGDRSHPFHATDQDVLNLTAMITPYPLSTLGPEGMDFLPAGFTMSHATGSPKPWKKRFVSSALQGVAPSRADKGYWRYTQTPIQLYSPFQLFQHKLDLQLGAAIGRFIHRA